MIRIWYSDKFQSYFIVKRGEGIEITIKVDLRFAKSMIRLTELSRDIGGGKYETPAEGEALEIFNQILSEHESSQTTSDVDRLTESTLRERFQSEGDGTVEDSSRSR